MLAADPAPAEDGEEKLFPVVVAVVNADEVEEADEEEDEEEADDAMIPVKS